MHWIRISDRITNTSKKRFTDDSGEEQNMNNTTSRKRLIRIYVMLLAATIMLVASNMSIYCEGSTEGKFNAGQWNRYRGSIYDRDMNVIVSNKEVEKEKDGESVSVIERDYSKCTPAYSAFVGVRNPASGRVEGLENTMSEWLLLGDDNLREIGGSLVLTTDSKLQEFCYSQIKDFDMAVCVVIDIETGEILAMTDTPAYNTSAAADAEKGKFDSVIPENSLYQFATEKQIPGSVFKLITSEAIVSYGKGNTIVNDTGSLQYDGHEVINAGRAKYGRIGMAQALRVSSNVYFSTVAKEIGSEPISEIFSKKFKLDSEIKLDFTTIKQNYCLQNRDLLYKGAIGQGEDECSPLYVCMVTAAAGSKSGDLFKPYLIKEYLDADGNCVKKGKKEIITHKAFSKETRNFIRQGMTMCANDKGIGTINGYQTAVKTGTAQKGDDRVNIWMTGYVPADNPKFAVTYAVFDVPEKGNWGSNLKNQIGATFRYLTSKKMG